MILNELERRGQEVLQAVEDAGIEAVAQGAGDEARTQAANDAADAAVNRILQDLGGRIAELADGMILRNLRTGFRDLLGVAQLQASSAAATAEDNLRPHRDAEEATREWHVRDRAALEEFDGTTDSLELPTGFGAPVLDADGQPRVDASGRIIRQYPLGHNGRFLGLGDAAVEDRAGIAALVASTLPRQDAHLAGEDRPGQPLQGDGFAGEQQRVPAGPGEQPFQQCPVFQRQHLPAGAGEHAHPRRRHAGERERIRGSRV